MDDNDEDINSNNSTNDNIENSNFESAPCANLGLYGNGNHKKGLTESVFFSSGFHERAHYARHYGNEF